MAAIPVPMEVDTGCAICNNSQKEMDQPYNIAEPPEKASIDALIAWHNGDPKHILRRNRTGTRFDTPRHKFWDAYVIQHALIKTGMSNKRQKEIWTANFLYTDDATRKYRNLFQRIIAPFDFDSEIVRALYRFKSTECMLMVRYLISVTNTQQLLQILEYLNTFSRDDSRVLGKAELINVKTYNNMCETQQRAYDRKRKRDKDAKVDKPHGHRSKRARVEYEAKTPTVKLEPMEDSVAPSTNPIAMHIDTLYGAMRALRAADQSIVDGKQTFPPRLPLIYTPTPGATTYKSKIQAESRTEWELSYKKNEKGAIMGKSNSTERKKNIQMRADVLATIQQAIAVDDRGDAFAFPAAALLTVDTVPDGDRRTPLIGQNRIVATGSLPVGTVLDIYRGLVLRRDEFEKVIPPLQRLDANRYAFSLNDDLLVTALPPHYGHDAKVPNLTSLINDPTIDVSRPPIPGNIVAEPNVEAAIAEHRGWPYVLFIVSRPISPGEELLFPYGSEYYWGRLPEDVAEHAQRRALLAEYRAIAPVLSALLEGRHKDFPVSLE